MTTILENANGVRITEGDKMHGHHIAVGALCYAAANPAAVSELLDRLEAAEKEREIDEQRIADLMSDLNRVGHENEELRSLVVMRFDHEHRRNLFRATTSMTSSNL